MLTRTPRTVATTLSIKTPGVLENDSDALGYPLTAEIVGSTGTTVTLNPDGSFTATVPAHAGTTTASFTYQARNSQGVAGAAATVTLTFPPPSNVQVIGGGRPEPSCSHHQRLPLDY